MRVETMKTFVFVFLATTAATAAAFTALNHQDRNRGIGIGAPISIRVLGSIQGRHGTKNVALLMTSSNDRNQYDLAKPVFDLYAARMVRGDALTKYNSLNQSEPLRINVSLFTTLLLLSLPWLVPEILNSGGGTPFLLSVPETALALAGAVGSAAFCRNECQARGRQLTRLEKECAVMELRIRLPANQFADAPYQRSATQIRTILSKSSGSGGSCRIIAVSGTAAALREALLGLRVLGRRLHQANTFVVVVPTDGSAVQDWGLKPSNYLAQVSDLTAWKDYFASLASDAVNDSTTTKTSYTFRWFGLSSAGRSFGSGTTCPSWLQVLGKSLSPVDVLDEGDASYMTDATQNNSEILLKRQERFYEALTNGNLSVMRDDVFDSHATDDEVSAVMQQGGRLDSWDACLLEGARPAGMKVSGCDVTQLSDTIAYTTCIEFPTATATGATLLAVQQWAKQPENGAWKLMKHQTIPWTPDQPAGGTLICDCRGCVSLVRTNERRTFGGLLG